MMSGTGTDAASAAESEAMMREREAVAGLLSFFLFFFTLSVCVRVS